MANKSCSSCNEKLTQLDLKLDKSRNKECQLCIGTRAKMLRYGKRDVSGQLTEWIL